MQKYKQFIRLTIAVAVMLGNGVLAQSHLECSIDWNSARKAVKHKVTAEDLVSIAVRRSNRIYSALPEIEARALLIAARDPDYAVVDLRSSEEFHRVHIPGSLNLRLNELPYRVSLGDKQVVLVTSHGQLPSKQKLGVLPTKLRKRISFLTNGINAWAQIGAPLQGGAADIQRLALIQPRVLWRLDEENLHILQIDGESEAVIRSGKWAGEVERITSNADQKNTLIVISDATGDQFEKWNSLIRQRSGGLTVAYLEHGYSGYEKYVQQLAMQDNHSNLLSNGGGCKL